MTKSKFGKVGLDVGVLGRLSRLIWGILILIPILLSIARDFSSATPSTSFYTSAVFYLLLIVVIYTLAYWFLGERLFAKANPWVNTAILVGPAFAIAWWPYFFAPVFSLQIPLSLSVAMGIYIGISFIIQWKIKYGGCEVVSIPILLFKKRYTTYCVPLVAVDAIEKIVVDRKGELPT